MRAITSHFSVLHIVTVSACLMLARPGTAIGQSEFIHLGARGSAAELKVASVGGSVGFGGTLAFSVHGWIDPGIAISRVSYDLYRLQSVELGVEVHPLRPFVKLPFQPSIRVFYEHASLNAPNYYYQPFRSTDAAGLGAELHVYASLPTGTTIAFVPDWYIHDGPDLPAQSGTVYGTSLAAALRVSSSRQLTLRVGYARSDGGEGAVSVGLGFVHEQSK